MDDVGAEHRQQLAGTAVVVHRIAPGRIGQIDPQRRTDIRQAVNARRHASMLREMLFVQIARPPGDVRSWRREIDHMLTGAAAGLHDVAGFAGKKPLQYRPDRLMIAVKCRASSRPSGSTGRPSLPNSTTYSAMIPSRIARSPACQALAFARSAAYIRGNTKNPTGNALNPTFSEPVLPKPRRSERALATL